jgi:lipoprotein-anchoring transpeptidase ErfK/SrfK
MIRQFARVDTSGVNKFFENTLTNTVQVAVVYGSLGAIKNNKTEGVSMSKFICVVLQKIMAAVAFAGFLLAASTSASLADVVARVDLSSQTMHVQVNGRTYARWKISSGRKGYRTPTGTWRPKWTSRMHYSRKYDYSPMPYSVFYNRGYAVHGTNYVRRLGRPASHGCIRLHTANARKFYNLVKRYGRRNTLIRVRY